jgi:hypothetical protein
VFKFIQNNKGNLEISLEGHLTEVELGKIISDIKSIKEEYSIVNILIDFTIMTGYDKVFFDKNESIKSLENDIERIAAVRSGITAIPLLEYMKSVTRKYREFNEENIEAAREWAFEERNNQT